MFGQVIRALIYLCFMALAFYLILWVLGEIGIALPGMVIIILKVVFVLVAILILYQLFSPYFGGINWWGNRPPPPVIVFAVMCAMALALSSTATNAHECWWNGHYWVCPPRMPEWRGYGHEREQEWDHRRHWCERHPYECGMRSR